MTDDPLAPVHPGEVLREEFLEPLHSPRRYGCRARVWSA
jgi:plasmid maintenance system antidote protein VapI